MRSMTEGANGVGIADGVARDVEAFAQVICVSDDELLHLVKRAVVLEEAIVEFMRVFRRREFNILRASG